MSPTRVLLLGGHGKISMHLTPLLLAKNWNVTSVIRNPDQEKEITDLGQGQPGKVDVLIASLDDVASQADAQKVLDKVNPDIVVWSAGKFPISISALTLPPFRTTLPFFCPISPNSPRFPLIQAPEAKAGPNEPTKSTATPPNTTSPPPSPHPRSKNS